MLIGLVVYIYMEWVYLVTSDLKEIRRTAIYREVNGVKYWFIGGVNTWVQAEGEDGKDGKDGGNPYIGQNGNWWIGDVDTGVKAKGEDAIAPTIINDNWAFWDSELGEFVESEFSAIGDDGHSPEIRDGYWWEWNPAINDYQNTGVRAEGKDGDVPYIGANGNWWIDCVDTGVKAEGKEKHLISVQMVVDRR